MIPMVRILILLLIFTFSGVTGCKAEKEAPSSPDVSNASEQESENPSRDVLIDINTASKAELIRLPGIGEVYAQKIMDGRPYKMKSQLKSRNIIPDATYDKITDLIIAAQHK